IYFGASADKGVSFQPALTAMARDHRRNTSERQQPMMPGGIQLRPSAFRMHWEYCRLAAISAALSRTPWFA
ncbi:hypothetical protein, partial [Pigmentiphaga soli]|uniref:hypothetical protein n=1 Tax=Pigmentiphaga soli TaxID=1007095 RepID=UPI0031E777C7